MNAASASVLVVDDDEDIRDALLLVLEDLGHQAAVADDGQEALTVLRALPAAPRLILLDLMMPVMNGWQFLAEREKDPALVSIPVVIMTGAVDAKVNATNVVAFLKKPVPFNTLVELLEGVGRPSSPG